LRQIITGATSPKSAVITSGIRLNEKISLLEPKSSLIEKRTLIAKPVKKIQKKAKQKPQLIRET